jgi:hypothetical protein
MVGARQLVLLPLPAELKSKLGVRSFQEIPATPGVYWMQNGVGKVLYVGQSNNLRRRLSSYSFRDSETKPRKVARMVGASKCIQWKMVESDLLAELCENELIRIHRPRFNAAKNNWNACLYLSIRESSNGINLSLSRVPQPQLGTLGSFKPGIVNLLVQFSSLWPNSSAQSIASIRKNGLLFPTDAASKEQLRGEFVDFFSGSSSRLIDRFPVSVRMKEDGDSIQEQLERTYNALHKLYQLRSACDLPSDLPIPRILLEDALVLSRRLAQLKSNPVLMSKFLALWSQGLVEEYSAAEAIGVAEKVPCSFQQELF